MMNLHINLENSLRKVKSYLLDLQFMIVSKLEEIDGKPFGTDRWNHPSGGGGNSRIIEDGNVLERGGVSFSHVMGEKLPSSAAVSHPELIDRYWEAMGVSLVIHPRNPFVPTIHMNIRFFTTDSEKGKEPVWWFGGCIDLTPYYGFKEDARHFHRNCRDAVTPFDENAGKPLYPCFKKWCDDYFYLKHRKEPRGIGGIFFDDFNQLGFEKSFLMMQNVGNVFVPSYMPILMCRKDTPYSDAQKNFQQYRRGRYVEFNLLYDRGTLFGLQSGGRTESIMMSLPPSVKWRYNWKPEKETPEAKLYRDFLIHREWI
jgi:coproporphyrinogen III oxidase